MSKETDWVDDLYREGATAQPPADLDRRIAEAARAALTPWYRRRGPLTGIATAAVLMLAVALMTFQPLPPDAPVPADALAPPAAPEPEFSDQSEPAGTRPQETRAESKSVLPAAASMDRRTTADEHAEQNLSDTDSTAIVRSSAQKTYRQDAAAHSCGPLPDPDAEILEIAEDADQVIRVVTSVGAWRCVDGEWQPVPETDAVSDQQ